MKKKFLVSIILVIAFTLVIISAVVIYLKNKSLDNDDIYFPEDVYTPSKLSDEEYNKLSKSIISKLEGMLQLLNHIKKQKFIVNF